MKLAHPIRRSLYVIAAGLWLTGALWLVFHYFLMRQTAFGPAPHPLEHWWLSLHGLFAFLSLWMFGWLWGRHIVWGWKAGRHRLTGGLLFGLLAELIITGYLLYYPPSDDSQAVIAVMHWTVGVGLLIPFFVHRFWRRTSRSAAAGYSPSPRT